MKSQILTPKETAVIKMLPHWKKDIEWLKLNHRTIYDKLQRKNKVSKKTKQRDISKTIKRKIFKTKRIPKILPK